MHEPTPEATGPRIAWQAWSGATTADDRELPGLGRRADLVAPVPGKKAPPGLTPDETLVLVVLGKSATIGEVVERCGLPEARTFAALLGLRAHGLIAPAKRGPARPKVVDASLQEEIDLPDTLKKEIVELDRTLDARDHFALLGIEAGATPEEIRDAYHRASRRFHPDRYFGKALGSYKGRLERIFKALSAAAHVLSDANRRAAYLEANPGLAARARTRPATSSGPPTDVRKPAPLSAAPVDTLRQSDRRGRLARHPYLAKLRNGSELLKTGRVALEAGNYAEALHAFERYGKVEGESAELEALTAEAHRRYADERIQILLQRGQEAESVHDLEAAFTAYGKAAEASGSRADLWMRMLRLGERLSKDPRELRQAAQRAVELNPKSVEARLLLAQVWTRLDQKKLARKELEAALELEPNHAEAKGQLRKLRWSL